MVSGDKIDPVKRIATESFEDFLIWNSVSKVDEWKVKVRKRLNHIHTNYADLPAADPVYHEICHGDYKHERCKIPNKFSDESIVTPAKKGRPLDNDRKVAFVLVLNYLESNEIETVTISDLVTKMGNYLKEIFSIAEPYVNKWMLEKLSEHYGDELVIISHTSRETAVSLQKSAAKIITFKNETR